MTVEKGNGYDLNRSLFERLVLKNFPHSTLVSQHRMRPEISALVRHLTYPELKDAPRTQGRPNLRGVQNNIVFINHAHAEDNNQHLTDRRDEGGLKSSKENQFEVDMIMRIISYLAQQGYKSGELVILTPYLGQLHKLQAALRLHQETDPVLNELDMGEFARAGVAPFAESQPKNKKLSLRLATIGES